MNIQSRFNLKDTVYYIDIKINSINKGQIKQVNYIENESGYKNFTFCVGEKYYNIAEEKCYESKEELIQALNDFTE